MTDTAKASVITDHPFEPRTGPVAFLGPYAPVWLSESPYLCKRCRLAEAAHRETTVKR